MTDDLIARAKAALEGVAEGPWEAPETLLGQRCTTVFGKDRKHVLYHAGTDENARFTAAARTLVPELIVEVERLRAREDVVAEASYRTGQLDAKGGVE